jgi:hypothetical protein
MSVPSHFLSMSRGAHWVRRCAECGLDDLSWRFVSPEQASRCGIWQNARRCRLCGHLGFDLVGINPVGRRRLRPHYQRKPYG